MTVKPDELRDAAEYLESHAYPLTGLGREMVKLVMEAADELERLYRTSGESLPESPRQA